MNKIQSIQNNYNHQQSDTIRSSNILQRLQEFKKNMTLPQSYRPQQQSQHLKFQKYLPEQYLKSAYNSVYDNTNCAGENVENYKKSLQKRLETLFQKQKGLFKLRNSRSVYQQHALQKSYEQNHNYIRKNEVSNFGQVQVDKMQRKIKLLQTFCNIKQLKYMNDKSSEGRINNKKNQQKVQSKSKSKTKKNYNKAQNQILKDRNQHLKTNDELPVQKRPLQVLLKQQKISRQIQSLKKNMNQIIQINKSLMEKLQKKQDRKIQKLRAKKMLQQILYKLDDIKRDVSFQKAQKTKYQHKNLKNRSYGYDTIPVVKNQTRLQKQKNIKKQESQIQHHQRYNGNNNKKIQNRASCSQSLQQKVKRLQNQLYFEIKQRQIIQRKCDILQKMNIFNKQVNSKG